MLNSHELAVLVLAVIFLLAYLIATFRSRRVAVLLAAISFPALYLTLEGTSQFLTIDETYSVPEVLDLRSSLLISWIQGALRTTDALTGPVMTAVSLLFHPTLVESYAVAKLFHWFLGFAVLLMIHRLLDAHLVPPEHRASWFVVYIYTALLLPTNALALKIFNYDLLSLGLTVFAASLLVLAVSSRSQGMARWAVIVSTLAAEEKLVASPLLILSVSALGYLRLEAGTDRKRYTRAASAILSGFGLAAIISLLTLIVVVPFRGLSYLPISLAVMLDPIISWLWPLLEFTARLASDLRSIRPSTLAIASVLAAYLLAVVAYHARRAIATQASVGAIRESWKYVNPALVVAALVTGVVGTLRVPAYWAPYAPIQPGYYQSRMTLNLATWHFEARTELDHLVASVAYSYAVFVSAMPSVFWLILTFALLAGFAARGKLPVNLAAELLLTVALLVPLGFGLFQIPAINRYLDVALFVVALAATLKVGALIAPLAGWKQGVYAALLVGLLCAEILPFRPIYAAFRPIWSNDDATYAQSPEVGRINPSWIGWGEEAMLAGQEITRRCAMAGAVQGIESSPCKSIRLHLAFPGYWLVDEGRVSQTLMLDHFMHGLRPPEMFPQLLTPDEFTYTDHDYYVMNRYAFVEGSWSFPAGVKPEFVIQFRGFIQAWVFRGDRLKAANVSFPRADPPWYEKT